MYGTLSPGTTIRTLTAADLNIPYDEGAADPQRAALPPPANAAALPGQGATTKLVTSVAATRENGLGLELANVVSDSHGSRRGQVESRTDEPPAGTGVGLALAPAGIDAGPMPSGQPAPASSWLRADGTDDEDDIPTDGMGGNLSVGDLPHSQPVDGPADSHGATDDDSAAPGAAVPNGLSPGAVDDFFLLDGQDGYVCSGT